ncbi:hypothetical protein B0H34DRAFT_690961 [Crassisporium funariophilum]|nr:hypothetical protein B0H34DRAFT_690961 [Crassisporium funariophilum]
MHTAEGIMNCNAWGRFTCTFHIDGSKYTFSGSFTSSVPPFTSESVKLTYNGLNQLEYTRQFDGHVGHNVKLVLINGPEIDGVLDTPFNPGSSVSGEGFWIDN